MLGTYYDTTIIRLPPQAAAGPYQALLMVLQLVYPDMHAFKLCCACAEGPVGGRGCIPLH